MILITGYKGMLGQYLKSIFDDSVGIDIDDIDLSSEKSLDYLRRKYDPEVIIHAAAYTDVEGAENNPYEAYKGNVLTTMNLAHFAWERDIYLVYFSTDYIFHGYRTKPIREHFSPNIKGVYAHSKYEGEKIVSRLRRHLIIRTSWLYGEGKKNFVEKIIELMKHRDKIYGVIDEVSSPTYAKDLAIATKKLINKEIYGIVNVCNNGYVSRYGWIEEIGKIVGYKGEILSVKQGFLNMKAPRPLFSALSCERYYALIGEYLPNWKDSLKDYLKGRHL